jgi:hypothetical protein
MTSIRIIGVKGSSAKIAISKNTGIGLYSGQRKVDAIVNYGLVGKKLHLFLKKYPFAAKNIPIINRYVGISKYQAIKKVENAGILVPKSKPCLSKLDKIGDWIEKRVHSSKGYGIRQARGRREIPGKYYQKKVANRSYELRVHAFKWVDKKDWTLNKRFGPADQIAWNFHQGGHFQSVRNSNGYQTFLKAKDISSEVLSVLNMSFGAVDFILDNNLKIYFIEINSAPGFTELNQGVYFSAFNALKCLPRYKLIKLGE